MGIFSRHISIAVIFGVHHCACIWSTDLMDLLRVSALQKVRNFCEPVLHIATETLLLLYAYLYCCDIFWVTSTAVNDMSVAAISICQ